MDYRSKLFVCVFLADTIVVLCLGQFEGIGLLALAGGLGGGGMGTGAMGMNRGAFSAGLGMARSGLTATQYFMLDRAVKEVVGPHAKPDPIIIAHAKRQDGTPRNMFQMMGYLPYFINIARTVGIQQPKIGYGQTRTGTNQTQNINDIVTQRAVQWMRKNAAMNSPVAFAF